MKTTDLFGRPLTSGQHSVLGQRFRWPPFSVFNAREGDWQERKRQWTALGIQSEIGRGGKLTMSGEVGEDIDNYRHKEAGKVGKARAFNEGALDNYNKYLGDERERTKFHAQPGGPRSVKSIWLANGKPVGGADAINGRPQDGDYVPSGPGGTSIFDPVLCELFYRWFTPAAGVILDPFAGGSVRGIVASALGRDYVGVDLRVEQILANEQQARQICNPNLQPLWLQGDSREITEVVKSNLGLGFKADAILACPPYFNLEIYSDDERDLSNTSWSDFVVSYESIIAQCVAMLKPNRFACFVVGDLRDKQGYYRGLPSLTIDCFESAGARLYNEILLITAVGSLPLRTARAFSGSRKIGRTHQSVLIFVKGDPRQAALEMENLDGIAQDKAELR